MTEHRKSFEQFLCMVDDALRTDEQPTYWLMGEETHCGVLMLPEVTQTSLQCGERRTLLGFPIVVDRRAPLNACELRSGPLADTEREDDLRRRLDEVQRDYVDASEPLIRELAEIERARIGL